MNKLIIAFAFLFFETIYTQNQSNADSTLNSLKVDIKANSTDSFEKPKAKTNIVVAKNYEQPKSDSYYDIATYVVKKQFQERPILSWILAVLLGFWILKMLEGMLKRK